MKIIKKGDKKVCSPEWTGSFLEENGLTGLNIAEIIWKLRLSMHSVILPRL